MKLINIFEERKPTPEELFKRLVLNRIDIENPVMDSQKYPWQVFWLDVNGKYICEWDYRYESFYFNYYVIWKVFEDELNINHDEVQNIMRDMLEKHFGLRGITITFLAPFPGQLVEKHFGLRGITIDPTQRQRDLQVEDHFNLKGSY